MAILNVAEKPSVAKSISHILSTECRSTKGLYKYCPNISFKHTENMVFTSVLGHLFTHDFKNNTKWSECDPFTLFDAEIQSIINPEYVKIAENIQRQAQGCEMVVIWTDCDREGENIAKQIERLVPNKVVKRARFNAITRVEIERALENLIQINEFESNAVETRIELDLRIGSAFTRIQTLSLSNESSKKRVLSFGPCQIPTLNFVVERHKLIANFVPENFYSLENKIVRNKIENSFKWKRLKIFDKNCVIHFYNVLSSGKAVITDKKVENKEKFRPLPLRTVEFQKTCSSYYKMSGHNIMEIAEKLYNNGYISYPRTETDSFPKNFGFSSVISKLQADEVLGGYAGEFTFKFPRSGSNDDHSHSPIYPLKAGNGLSGDERKIFDFVARRFLGCISENAKGVETEYTMKISGQNIVEEFNCKGLQILERNYLDVYIYDKWESNEIADFKINEVVENNLEMTTGATTKPNYLSESDLIALMDKHGIGTDATIHEHIQKIQVREYVKKVNFKFIPLSLGINLIDAYNEIGLPISQPDLRKNLELNLKRICANEKTKESLICEEVAIYKEIYKKLERNIAKFKEIIKRQTPDGHDDDSGSGNSKKKKGDDQNDSGNFKKKKGDDRNKSKFVKDDKNRSKFEKDEYGSNRKFKNDESNGIKKKGDEENFKNVKTFNKPSNNPKNGKILCDCKKEASKIQTKKGANSGRFFFACHDFPKVCNYFKWADEDAPEITTTYAKPKQEDCDFQCKCGYDAHKKTAFTEKNYGREFYCCKKSYKKCDFFKWADEE